ncbi:MAG: tetratricopeptide repeat protein [Balneolaceae bacterium]|nr:tetratricopeptide repeat protein [Balneolaceae bacterium]
MKANQKKEPKDGERRPLSRKKRMIFGIITFLIPVLVLILLETFLRLGNYGGNLDLFYFPEKFGGKYGMLNQQYHDKFFFQTSTFQAGRGDVFLRDKPENGFRVFVLGASTTEGFPYGYNGMFSLVIRDMLQDVMPSSHVEVVNLGITATNSYTVYDQTEEILKYEPDAILIYSGQNEYYGALGVASSEIIGRNPTLVRAYMKLYHYRTFLMMRDAIGWLINRVTGYDKFEESGTLMERMVSQNSIPLGSDLYKAGVEQFSNNLEVILQSYRDYDVPVFLSSLVSNLKDHPPFYSVETENHPPADEVFETAKTEYSTGDFEKAYQSFVYAKDLDALRFRAPSSFNEMIREMAEQTGVWYVPMNETMSAHAENGIIGSDLMLEHLHPNSEGYFLMGKVFFDALAGSGVAVPEQNLSRLRTIDQYRESMYLTELDHRIVWHRVEALKNSWPFVTEPDPGGYPINYTPESELDRLAINHAQEHISWEEAKTTMARWYSQNGLHDKAIREIRGALRVVPYEEEAWRFAGWLALQGEKRDQAVEFYQKAYEIKPTNNAARNLGMTLVDLEQYEEAADYLEEAYNLDQSDHNSLFNASVAHASAENYQKALDLAERLAKINPNYPDLQMWRMHLLTRNE